MALELLRFNPRPPLLAGDASAYLAAEALGKLFQSAPAIAGGRCSMTFEILTLAQGFNPRPPLLAGDATLMTVKISPMVFQSAPAIAGGRCRTRLAIVRAAAVSIRARHCWRAMPDLPRQSHVRGLFQSAPAIAGGRCRRQRGDGQPLSGFNPRPPLLAGDAA